MTRKQIAAVATLLFGLVAAHVHASGQAGVYGVIEKVVVEPASGPAERVQVWGAFALMETIGRGFTGYVYKQPQRGYMYFKLPAGGADIENARREWKDLASVAGTMQAVAFGYWDRNRGDAFITVRNPDVAPVNADVYYTDMGIAQLSSCGNRTVEALLQLAASK